MKIFNFLDGKRQMFVFGIIVVVLLTSGIGVVESRVALVEGDLEDMEEDALWESAQKKCKIYNKEPEFNQDEYLVYLKKVEEANPDADWKKITAALHYQEFGVDMDRTLPIIPLPLFIHGDETLGYTSVDLVCRIGRTKNYNAPQFVYDKNCQKIDIAHSYAGPRSDLGRGNGIGDLFGLWPWFMRRANTNWGDTWQSVMKMKWDPPDQFAGDHMGLWLSDYYRNPKNQNTPLSSAYKEYFDSQSGKRVCNNEEVCKKAGYYWYDDQCNEEKKEISEEEPPLKDYFDKCQPIKETRVMGENIDMKVLHEIKGEVEGKCEVCEKVVEDNTGYGFEGKEMTCLIPMTIITEGTALSDDDVRTYCTGSLIDAINNLTGG